MEGFVLFHFQHTLERLQRRAQSFDHEQPLLLKSERSRWVSANSIRACRIISPAFSSASLMTSSDSRCADRLTSSASV